MPKFLYKVNLSAEGMRGTLEEGGVARRNAIAELARSLGGSLEAFYYAFGETDAYVIIDVPDAETAAATAITVSLSGVGSIETVVLIDPEQIDAIAAKSIDYRPPGG